MDEPRKRLGRFIGEWTMRVTCPGAPPVEGGRVVFEWMAGEQFLIQRWEVPVPEAPDGLAVIGFNDSRGTFLQHYFDSRGIARVYGLALEAGVLRLWRDAPEDYSQRYEGRLSDDGAAIVGAWEMSEDGATWRHDFDLTYRRA